MITDLIALLLADAGVSGVVGTRVYPGRRPQGSALPSLTVGQVSGAPSYAEDGEVGLGTYRVQVDSWAATFGAARDLSALVRTALSGYSSTTGSLSFIQLIQETDLEEGGGNEAEYDFRVVQDYQVLARE